MALFGAPLADEDHALRASYAALAMQRAIAESPDSDITIRVGLHSGPVVVRSIENDLSINYDASGSAVHLAARMEQLAQVGKIRITEDTYRLVEGFIDAESLGPVDVKGLSKPIQIFLLAERQTARTRWQVRAARGLTKLIGRDSEFETLKTALAQAIDGHGQLVTIEADPGVGKSRLVHEFLADLGGQDLTVVESSGLPEGQPVPYQPVESMLRAWLAVEDQDAPDIIAQKLSESVAALDESLLTHLAAYQDVLHIEVSEAGWRALEPAERRARIRRAIPALVLNASIYRPVVLVLEDVHWVDAETLAILDLIVDQLGSSHVLVVISYRPEFANPWRDRAYHTGLRLEPLDHSAAIEFLGALLGPDTALDELKMLVVERSAGTPLFIEEIVGDLKHSGVLVQDRDRLTLTKAVEEIDIPATVQAVIASRIDRLPREVRDLLQIASVIRKTVPAALLRNTAGLNEATLLAQMSELLHHGLMLESQLVPHVEYVFKHALTRDVAYESILKARRRAIHADVVYGIEARYGNQIDRYLDRLAHHAEGAEMWDAAVKYAGRAALRALDRSAYAQAIRHLDSALQSLLHLPENRGRAEQEIDLRLALRAPLGAAGDVTRMHQRLAEAERLAEQLNDEPRLGAIKVSQTFAFNYTGDLDKAAEAGTSGLEISERIGDPELALAGSYHLAQAYMWSGQFKRVRDLLAPGIESVVSRFREHRIGTAGTISVLWLGMLGAAEAYLGSFDEAQTRIDQALAIANDLERPYDEAMARWYMGFCLSHRGAHTEAVGSLEDAYQWCNDAQIDFLVPVVATSLGYAYANVGRADEAVMILEDAIERYARTGLSYGVAYASLNKAFTLMQIGDAERCVRLMKEATELAVRHGFAGIEVAARRLQAVALGQAKGKAEEAEAEALRSLELAEERDMLPDVAHCHLVLTRLWSQKGDLEAAKMHAATAIAMYRDLGMPSWLERAQKLVGKASTD